MSQPEEIGRIVPQPDAKAIAKKPYQKPEFRFEQVFETRALSCGKVNATQGQCANNRKSS
jgi:hypothetical protein